MKRSFTCLLLLCAPLVASAEVPAAVVAAASKIVPGVTWKTESIVVGNFSCRGRIESAILGATKSEIVIAVFVAGISKPPKLLRYSTKTRDPSTSELKIEDGDFDSKEFQSEVGYLPDGLRPSKTCKGLNLSDGKIDSSHIYWNHNTKQFSDWVL